MSVRGENYIAVLDGATFEETARIAVPNGPGMTIFSPDGKYGYVCSSFTPETDVIEVADHRVVARVARKRVRSPEPRGDPDGSRCGSRSRMSERPVFDAGLRLDVLKTLDTGPITNHVNSARNAKSSSPT